MCHAELVAASCMLIAAAAIVCGILYLASVLQKSFAALNERLDELNRRLAESAHNAGGGERTSRCVEERHVSQIVHASCLKSETDGPPYAVQGEGQVARKEYSESGCLVQRRLKNINADSRSPASGLAASTPQNTSLKPGDVAIGRSSSDRRNGPSKPNTLQNISQNSAAVAIGRSSSDRRNESVKPIRAHNAGMDRTESDRWSTASTAHASVSVGNDYEHPAKSSSPQSVPSRLISPTEALKILDDEIHGSRSPKRHEMACEVVKVRRRSTRDREDVE